jgi:peroxiredoxin Q/BCP
VARGVEIFGVNQRGRESHAAFRARHRFPFRLLVDAGRKVAKLYRSDALVVVKRTVYLIGPDGVILFAERGMPSPQEVLAAAPDAL